MASIELNVNENGDVRIHEGNKSVNLSFDELQKAIQSLKYDEFNKVFDDLPKNADGEAFLNAIKTYKSAREEKHLEDHLKEYKAKLKECKAKVYPWLKEQIKEICNEDGFYNVPVASYDDKISGSVIFDAFKTYQKEVSVWKDTRFDSYLRDLIDTDYDAKDYYNSWIIDTIERNARMMGFIDEYLYLLQEEYNDNEMEMYCDIGGFEGLYYDMDEWIGETAITLMFGTKEEQNCDMGSINNMFREDFAYDNPDDRQRYFDNALTYLVEQQGHTLSELVDARYKGTDNRFLASVSQEIDNLSDYMGELTLLVKMKGNELVEFLDAIGKGEGNIIADRNNVTIGLFNEWSGAGAMFEIMPEKDVVLPCSMIRNVQINGERKSAYEYTVESVYSMSGSAWKEAEFNKNLVFVRDPDEVKKDYDLAVKKFDKYVKERQEEEKDI